jgi:hypothetical protein
MSVAKDCQRYAVRCLQNARMTIDPRQKTFLVEMAQAWQRLAERENHAASDYTWAVSELDRGD